MTDLITATPGATAEGNQEMRTRSELTAKEVMREVGSVLRLSESEAAALANESGEVAEDSR